ncbi:MAG: hypothetical protein R2940_02250 [Syntrophotaleaceae bacterium]
MKRTVLATFLISLLLGGMAFAAPTAQIVGGLTNVEISSEVVQAFESMNITPSAIVPGALQNGTVSFPIPAGAIDAGNAKGDIFHAGGLGLMSSDTEVSLLNFIIDTTGDAPVLTGLVATDDNIVDRIPLFNLELPQSVQPDENGTLVISDVNLTLTQEAADALNGAFGNTAFQANSAFGTATVVAQSLPTGDMEDGAANGTEDGAADGTEDGATDGAEDGMTDGAEDGMMDGSAAGSAAGQ